MLTFSPQLLAPNQAPNLQLQTAIKNLTTGHVFYFAIPVDFSALLASSGQVDRQNFIPKWKVSTPDSSILGRCGICCDDELFIAVWPFLAGH
eukprot:22883-Eustigmatos_ZCMA.PRE.1